jgi:galactose-1-phosphate uridylyltransferase
MDRDIEDTRQPKYPRRCPICDGDVECTPTGWKCTECDWARDYADFDREVDK